MNQHVATYVQSKQGKVKVYCSCGWQSPRVASWREAREKIEEHERKEGE